MQRFLQPDILKKTKLHFFDKWAATFGDTISSLEINPEGSGYRLKNRFSKFHNLPEVLCCRGGLKRTLLKQHGNRPSVAILARLPAA